MNQIQHILNRYIKTFPLEQERLQPLFDLVNDSNIEDLISRKNFRGHVTASGFVIDISRRKVLRLQHKTLQKLLQPGGHVEPEDESPLEGAKREIQEETGITSLDHIAFHPDYNVPIDIDTHTIPAKGDEAEHQHHDFRYLFICRNSSEFVWIEDEFEEYEWGDIGELMRMETFERLKPKIETALSKEFRSKLFFDQVVETTKPATPCCSIVVGHCVPDVKVFLRALNVRAPIQALIPKPKSIDHQIAEELVADFPVCQLKREDILKNPGILVKLINHAPHPCVLFDIGGWFAPITKELVDKCGNKLLAIVEDTENGLQKYEKQGELAIPVISVARSPLKQNEDFLVGQSILFSCDAILRSASFNIEYQTCAVFGYGKIGSSIAQHLLLRGVKPWVFDKNPLLRIAASNRMCLIPPRDEILTHADVIFCATGKKVLGLNEFRQLKPGCVICSVTSADDELNLTGLTNHYEHEEIKPYIDKYTSFGNYFYLINKGNAANFAHKPALGSYIHLVRAEMMYALNMITQGDLSKNGIQELSVEDRSIVAEAWLATYADDTGGHHDLGISG
ncbi:NUDIX domain-containing protein [Gimesia maris]|uniref:NUDIX domain-containing protein n=1 Tax=Gimesia maris TaxID=122 RepID=UPI0018D60873|nr:NUDIX domain-containing protein [Gimesia maris]